MPMSYTKITFEDEFVNLIKFVQNNVVLYCRDDGKGLSEEKYAILMAGKQVTNTKQSTSY